MVPRRTSIVLYSHAAVFCCPSIYEPFGLINLEAMACTTPVVASAVGGIPEVVVDGETGYLVDPDLSSEPPYAPRNAARFATRLAEALNRLLADPVLRRRMGQQGRARVEQHYSWGAVAQQTLALYRRLQRV
jgi:glycosyltransferase involved in cell wall biosynthesis